MIVYARRNMISHFTRTNLWVVLLAYLILRVLVQGHNIARRFLCCIVVDFYCCVVDLHCFFFSDGTSKKVHGYTVHQQYWTLFYYQLMHITLKDAELLKYSKLDKNAPTCFGLYRNHLQGAKVSAWLKVTRLVNSICVKDVQGVISAMATYCDL